MAGAEARAGDDGATPGSTDTDAGASTGAPRPGDEARFRDEPPAGLREQVAATKDAVVALAQAHVDLARSEAEEIGREVGRAIGLAVLAFACVLLLSFLLYVGLWLFLGATLFGSMGWGVLMGTLLLVGIATFAILAAVRVPGLVVALGIAFVIGVVLVVLLGPALPHRLWTLIGEQLNLSVGASERPLAVAAVLWGIVGAVVGLVAGYRTGRTGRAAAGGLVAGLVLGMVLGAISAITFPLEVAFALGITTWLLAWPILMGVQAARVGIDEEGLKRRFTPQITIETTKETIEWAKARMPLGPRS